jgi:hypothetical protein
MYIRKRTLIRCSIVVGTSLVIMGTVATVKSLKGAGTKRKTYAAAIRSSQTKFAAHTWNEVLRSPAPGVLTLSVQGSDTITHRDNANIWLAVKIHSHSPWTGVPAWEHHFDKLGEFKAAPRGKSVRLELKDFTIPIKFAPGHYTAWVQAYEDAGEMTRDLQLLDTKHGRSGSRSEAVWVE